MTELRIVPSKVLNLMAFVPAEDFELQTHGGSTSRTSG